MGNPLWSPRGLLFAGSSMVAGILSLGGGAGMAAQESPQRSLQTIGPEAIFKPSSRAVEMDVIQKIQACGTVSARAGDPEHTACVVSIMQQAGASPAAMAFAEMLDGEGYLDSFRKMGKVDLAGVIYPARANTNGEYLLVNGTPRVVHVDDPDNLKHIDLRKDPLYASLVRKFPNLTLWGNGDFKTMQHREGGGQRFVFSLVLLNGCHACEVGGYADIAFDFDQAGSFSGTKLLRLRKAASKT
jgi:hypothetical protein